jgi:NinB protein
MKYTHYGNIKDSKLFIINRKIFDKDMASMDGKQVEIVVSPKKKTRSNQQNRYYWSVVVGLIKEGFVNMGHEDITAENTHDFLKARFLSKEVVNEQTGEVLNIPTGTADLTTTDFMVFIDKCSKFAAEYLNVIIPEPNSQTEINY